jgi:hypothetical protein
LHPPVKHGHRKKFSGKPAISGNALIQGIQHYYQDKIVTKEKPAGSVHPVKLIQYHFTGKEPAGSIK